MAPRNAPPRGQAPPAPGNRGGRGGGGRGRGGGAPRGGGVGGGQAGPARSPAASLNIPEHVRTIGVRRPDYGTGGKPLSIFANAFSATIPETIICHYDVVITPESLPSKLNMQLINQLQTVVAVSIFTPPAVYDGKKNMFAPRRLDLGPNDSQEFDVTMPGTGNNPGGRPPRVYKVRLTKVNEINTEILQRFVQGVQSHDETVLTAIMALNVVIRMLPSQKYPFNVRSFFPGREKMPVGGGLELWRGYFQSVRPSIGRIIVNVDISTGMMFKPGPLIEVSLDFFGKNDPNILSPSRGMPDRERIRLQRFLTNVKVEIKSANRTKFGVVRSVSRAGADALTFERNGQQITVAQYFQTVLNRPLRYPHLLCVEIGRGAMYPFELCQVPPGQIARKQVPPDVTKKMVEFSTMKPQDRFNSIKEGIQSFCYGQSEYVREFGMHVDTTGGVLPVQARVLRPPTLRYGTGSRQPTIDPRNGSWNMIDKRFFQPSTINQWVIVIYERQQRFGPPAVQNMIKGMIDGCQSVGMTIRERDPIVKYQQGQGRIGDQLRAAGGECQRTKGGLPNLIVVVLPDGGDDIYKAVKHFGDVTVGVATQCLKSNKVFRANQQYWANVLLKVNVKLGGINLIPDQASVSVLTDPRNPTIVMGADVMHPAPGATDRPSFTSLVSSVDSNTAKYVAISRVQTSRQEIISDLKGMCKEALKKNREAKNPPPQRLIFYRDGVSEGQFRHVLEQELPEIQDACKEMGVKPRITLIIVGKRHHIRFMTANQADADRSGNCPAGTVADRDIAHPTEFDWYLLSHGGLLGTSRPSHYSVLYDENGFKSDSLHALSFALCHVYARSTRSVSIPAPVYYADIVCSRAKNHYDPEGGVDLSETVTTTSGQEGNQVLEAFRQGFKPLNVALSNSMYFM